MLSRHKFTSGPLSVFKTEREYFTCSIFIPVSTVTAVRQKKNISGYKTRLVSNRSPRWVTAFMIKTCFIAITELPFKYGQFYERGNPLI